MSNNRILRKTEKEMTERDWFKKIQNVEPNSI